MQTSTVKLYTFGYSETRTYLVAALFIVGNITVPQLFHLIPKGGLIWLPIYFFTLVGAYKYGWKVGFLTAILSPIVNSLVFGMPSVSGLPVILLKSTILAFSAGCFASRFNSAALWQLLIVVLSYQVIGTLGEWILKGDFFDAIQDFRIGIPGMLMQVIGGWLIINCLIRR
ncbi:MAG: ECF transporter S component [Muribaculum sp.]|nr:ECF transporter S component [Muribaculum sp.]